MSVLGLGAGRRDSTWRRARPTSLKEQLLWVRHFRNVEEPRLALVESRHSYNRDWLIGRLGYRSPLDTRNHLQAAAAAA